MIMEAMKEQIPLQKRNPQEKEKDSVTSQQQHKAFISSGFCLLANR
jgi:molybdopterin synthase catalytic subunit